MKKVKFLLVTLFFSQASLAIEENRCLALLQDGVRDYWSNKYSDDFLSQAHSAMCSEKQDRIEKSKKQGLDLGYGDFVADFMGSNKKIASYQESMCSENEELDTRDTFYEAVRNHINPKITSDYVDCIRISEGGLVYTIKDGREGDSITIDVEYSRRRAPKAVVSVTDLVISPKSLEGLVSCAGSLANVSQKSPVEINQSVGVKSVTCRPGENFPRTGDVDFTVSLHTDAGSINGYVHPYHKGKSDRLDQLDKKYSNLVGRNTLSLSKFDIRSGSVDDQKKVFVPWGTTDDWNIILTPIKLGHWEIKDKKISSNGSKDWNQDNQIIQIELYASPTKDKKAWVITSKQAFKLGERYENVHPPEGTKANYLISPKKI